MKAFVAWVFTLYLLMPVHAVAGDQRVWIAVLIEESPQRTVEYYGEVLPSVMEAILAQSTPATFFRMYSVFWYDEFGQPVKLSQSRGKKLPYGFMDDAYFRYDSVKRVFLVDAAVVAGNLEVKPLEHEVEKPDMLQCELKACLGKWLH